MKLAKFCPAPKTAVARVHATPPLASALVAMGSKGLTALWFRVPTTALDAACATMRLRLVIVALSSRVLIVHFRDAQRHATTTVNASMDHAGATLVSVEKTAPSATAQTTARSKAPALWERRSGCLMHCLVCMKKRSVTTCRASASQDGLVRTARSLRVGPSAWPVEAFVREGCLLNWSQASWRSCTIRRAARTMECVSAEDVSATVDGQACRARSPCALTTVETTENASHSLPLRTNHLERPSAPALKDGTAKIVRNLSANRPAMATAFVSTAHVHVSKDMKARHAPNAHSTCTATALTSVQTTAPCSANPHLTLTSKESESSALWGAPKSALADV